MIDLPDERDPDLVAARAARLSPAGWPPAIALAGDVDATVLRAAGWRIAGRLPTTPYDDRRDAVGYVDLDELLVDATLDAVCLDGADPTLSPLLPSLRAAGLLLLLPTPAPLDVELLRAARRVGDTPEAVVALVRRYEPWAVTVAAALPLAGGTPLQVTVRGWPRGPAAAAELVDLARSWCGEVVGVVAAPAALPADELPGGARVSWALLTGTGATVLVSHEGAGVPLVRLSFSTARLEAGPDTVRWVGGADIPLITPAVALSGPEYWQGGHPGGQRLPRPMPPRPHPEVRLPADTPPGLLACAVELTRAAGGGGLQPGAWPRPADLGDLLVAARVLEALRESARTEVLVHAG